MRPAPQCARQQYSPCHRTSRFPSSGPRPSAEICLEFRVCREDPPARRSPYRTISGGNHTRPRCRAAFFPGTESGSARRETSRQRVLHRGRTRPSCHRPQTVEVIVSRHGERPTDCFHYVIYQLAYSSEALITAGCRLYRFVNVRSTKSIQASWEKGNQDWVWRIRLKPDRALLAGLTLTRRRGSPGRHTPSPPC